MTATAPRIVAAIDVGTNSVKIIVVDATAGCERLLYENTLICRLGEGMQAYGMRLKEAAIRRTLEALEELVQQARAHGAQQIAAVGTAALREAQNRDEFLQRAQERLGIPIEVISGTEEARLSYLAVRRDPMWRESPRLMVVDIGGGSTEVIVGDSAGKDIAFRVSLEVGAVRLTERFLRSDPPTLAQLDGASQAVRAALEHLPATLRQRPCTLVGVGGTIANLAAIDKGGVQSATELHHHVIPVARLDQILRRLATLSIEERKTIPGLEPARADIIVAGALILSLLLSHLEAEQIAVSIRGLRWGLLYDRFCHETSS
ncbi:Ppx/GppA phosphatase [Chthonomonas calidirosea]|uniref:Ppx/GppA phosphatase n=1 Tax=Chthonomonas calidirosea (strain DSM 23976 / ICMP 18418 / T49) TaxID=1303518 RepID=S0EYF6_CHTCT|nr:Ppx/GppA phosphatase family protein [Chthonomonas calidirosea]CCW36700.1 Ppx/GppA phosphatase [Chthonomonas calidirosea T49]CEK15434.1 Ppx/GppA phosphatase [Chthonomonas calidirosea]CEK15448.1 Ppx/GppA phosphatase [Chthonomonas calidirosea]CEK16553.1 Ppx/GppA phosphatase [Chthonomonas calidirosea]